MKFIRIGILVLFVLLTSEAIGQITKGAATGVIGLQFNYGRHSTYGQGGLGLLIRPLNCLELEVSFISGGAYEGGGFETGISGYLFPYRFQPIAKSKLIGPLCINPFLSVNYQSYLPLPFVVRNSNGSETSYRNPGNRYVSSSINLKIEGLELEGHKVVGHAFFNTGISYRYSLTNDPVVYTSGTFEQLNLDAINLKASAPFGFYFGGGFYIQKILCRRTLPDM